MGARNDVSRWHQMLVRPHSDDDPLCYFLDKPQQYRLTVGHSLTIARRPRRRISNQHTESTYGWIVHQFNLILKMQSPLDCTVTITGFINEHQ